MDGDAPLVRLGVALTYSQPCVRDGLSKFNQPLPVSRSIAG